MNETNNCRQEYEAPAVECIMFVPEAGIAASPVSNSSIESIDEVSSGYSSSEFWG